MGQPGNIYILGAGSIGGLIAYELSKVAKAPQITLLLRNASKVEHFKNVNNSTITINRLFQHPVEKLSAQFQSASAKDIRETIDNLIVTTKTYQTEAALQPYIEHITPATNILLVQNGLGVVEQLYKNIWPTLDSRPNIFQGVTTHGAFIASNTEDRFEISHAGSGQLDVAKIPKDLTGTEGLSSLETSSTMINELINAQGLKTTLLPYSKLLLLQLKKFTVNACINSVTSIVDCFNGELNSLEHARTLFYSIVKEAIDVFFETIPLLSKITEAKKELSPDLLVDNIIEIGTVVCGKNSSSMRQDTLNKRDTEIDYINGYVVQLAKDNHLRADVNETITSLVKLRTQLNKSRPNSFSN